jgi:hypothetical protein
MTKETPELISECWQLLVEYIPRRDHTSAAEQLVSYLNSILDKDELRAVADLDSDLNEAYQIVAEEEDADDAYWDPSEDEE